MNPWTVGRCWSPRFPYSWQCDVCDRGGKARTRLDADQLAGSHYLVAHVYAVKP